MIDLERWKIISREIITKLEERSMLYLIYIVLGLLIVLAVNYAVTAFFAVHDWLGNRDRDQLSFGDAFKKYFAKNNNIPTKFSDLFN